MKGSFDTTAFGWFWPGIPCHAYTRHTRLDLPRTREKGMGRWRENAGLSLFWLKDDLEAVGENIADDGHCKIRGIRKFHWIITKPNKLMLSRPILALYCMWLSHTITCPFLKYFKILYIFVQIFKYFNPFFNISLLFFWKITTPSLYFLE